MAKEKTLFFFALIHTLIIFLKCGNTLPSPFYFLLHAQLSLLAAPFFFSLVRHLVATLTFALCAAIIFLYSSICGTPKNLIYIVFIYYPTDLHS